MMESHRSAAPELHPGKETAPIKIPIAVAV